MLCECILKLSIHIKACGSTPQNFQNYYMKAVLTTGGGKIQSDPKNSSNIFGFESDPIYFFSKVIMIRI
jgi:hypothetical protein